jgi:hypothetical protein
MTKKQRTLSFLYELQEEVVNGTTFSKLLNEMVKELEKDIQENHLIPLV